MENKQAKRPLSSGFLLFMMLMSMVAGAMALNKVSPILSLIIEDLNLSGSAQGGLLISVFAVSGIFLSIPIGMIMQKFGYFKTGAAALLFLLLGSLIGSLTGSYGVLLLSRVIEGIGLIILTTIGPAVISSAYQGKRLGTAMGILMCFMTFGQIIMFNSAPAIASAAGWKAVWWVTSIYSLIFLILWISALRGLDQTVISTRSDTGKVSLFPEEVFKSREMWCLGLTFMLYLIAQQGVIAFLPTYLSSVRQVSSSLAGSMTSIASIVGIPTAILTGLISDRLGSRKKLIVILMFFSAIVYAVMPFFPTSLFGLEIALFGISTMGIVGICMSAASELVSPEYGGMAMAFMNTMQWIGIFLSSTIFGMLVDGLGYTGAFLCLVPISVIGAVLTMTIENT